MINFVHWPLQRIVRVGRVSNQSSVKIGNSLSELGFMDPKDLFSNLSPDSLPEWASVAEVLEAIEDELGEDARNELEEMLEGRELPDRVNVRELLGEIQEELGEPYFDHFLNPGGGEFSRKPDDDNPGDDNPDH